MYHFKRILVPVDFSDEAALAVSWANRLVVGVEGGTIVLLNTPLPAEVFAGPYEIPAVVEPLRDEARKTLEQWRDRVKSGVKTEAIVGLTDPADDIAAYCESNPVDLVIMTTRGRHGLNRLVHPNLSETIVRRVRCPVMVLHLNDQTIKMAASEDEPLTPSWRGYAEDYDAD